MKKGLLFLCSALLISSAVAADKSLQLEKCLLECYGLDPQTSSKILERFSPLLEGDEYDPVLDKFIEESSKFHISSSDPIESTDKLLEQYPPHHAVLFENGAVRISWAATKSGEQEPPQVHPWTTLMVIIRPAPFHSERADGVCYEDDWPIGTYLLEPFLVPLSCKNIGPEEYNGIIFEIKQLR